MKLGFSVANKQTLVVCGSIAIDRIMSFSGRYKDLLSLGQSDSLSLSVFLSKLENSYGGVGANIAYTMALLGEKPILLGSIGKEARDYLERLSSLGIDTSHLHISDLPTASFNVITDEENNQIGGFYPGAMFDSDNLTLKKWRDKKALVVIAPHDPKAMRRQIEECEKYKLKMCYDIGQQVVNTPVDDLVYGLSQAEILILNEFEMSALCKKIGCTIHSLKSKIPLVITTLGEKGSLIEGKDVASMIKIGIVELPEVLDPTGAGDAYRGGFFSGFIQGLDLKTCAQMGSLAASYAVGKYGTQEHKFTRDEFIKKYEDCFGEKLLLT